jgi:cytochrome c553
VSTHAQMFGELSDEEIARLWAYIQTVSPARPQEAQ